MIRALTLTCVLLLPAQLFAADARQLFTDGSKALAAGKADEAIADFDAAYKARPAPSLLYWLGEAHRTAGHNEKAAEYYKQYLAALPAGPNAAAAQQHLAELMAAAPAKPEHKKSRRRREVVAEMDLAIPPPPPPKATDSLALPTEPAKADALALPEPAGAGSAEEARRIAEARRAAKANAQPVNATPPANGGELAIPDLSEPAHPAVVATLEPTLTPPPPATALVVPIEPTPPPPRPLPPPPPPMTKPNPPVVVKPPPPAPAEPMSYYLTYTARLLAPHGVYMISYATTSGPGDGTLYTHGLGAGVQWDQFKLGGYLGFGTEFGGGNDTLYRYELSGQFQWVPLGAEALISPYLGARLGAMMVKGVQLTGNSLEGGFVFAPQGGVTFQFNHYIGLNLGLGYDVNVGPSLNHSVSLSGYSFDLGLTARY